ncbi:MAG TPA: YegP family protein [Pyrinomonadaceae bacterium]|nr:YegP family protein [Pyrinomonadaceae bacterium]
MAGKFELKTSVNGKFHFNLKAGNGQIILSSEMYESRSAAENGIESVKKNAADDARFERRTSAKGDPYFVLKAGNGQEIGRSEMYNSPGAMENGIESVKTNGPDAAIADATA